MRAALFHNAGPLLHPRPLTHSRLNTVRTNHAICLLGSLGPPLSGEQEGPLLHSVIDVVTNTWYNAAGMG